MNTPTSTSAWETVRAAAERVLQAKVILPVRPLLHLVAFYPLLLIVPVILLLFSWDVLMGDYDAFHQLWNEKPLTGILVGFCAAVVLGQVVLATYLFDESRGNPAAIAARRLPMPPRWTYWSTWGLLLLAVVAPAVVLTDHFAAPGDEYVQARAAGARLWFPLGALIAVGVFSLLRLTASQWFQYPERIGYAITIVIVGGFILMTAAHAAFPAMYCPWFPSAVNLLLLLGFLTAMFALFTYHARRHTPLLYPGLIGLFIVPFLIPACQTEYRLPNMNVVGEEGTYYDRPYRLAGYPDLHQRAVAGIRSDKGLNGEGIARLEEAGLINDGGALRAWHARMLREYGEAQPLYVVTVSGGASASALYSADVLFTLEEMYPGFSDRIRLVSGASGGMLGAAYFVTQLRPEGLIAKAREKPEYRAYVEAAKAAQLRPDDLSARQRLATAEEGYKTLMKTVRAEFFHGLEADFLGPLVQKWVHQDMPLSAFPRTTTNDRGQALELAWKRYLHGSLDVPFRDLRVEEQAGKLPSLVFTPMMVEDGRQLIISNLNLNYMVETSRDVNRLTQDNPTGLMSYMGVEFFRMFPKADQFRLSTAVRMSASFPYFSPSATLPTDPVRHVVDAGYYDNYGTTVATKWLIQNREWLSGLSREFSDETQKIPEVVMLRIRCFGYERSSLQIATEKEIRAYSEETGRSADSPGDLLDEWEKAPPARPIQTQGGLYSVSAPLFGLFSSWRANMVYRADERLGAAMARLRPRARGIGEATTAGVPFYAYAIECQVNPSLNWVLSARDLAAIHADVRDNLKKWAEFNNFFQSRSATAPSNVSVPKEQTRPPIKPGEKPTAAGAVQADPEFKGAQPGSRASKEAQAEVTGKLGELKFPNLPPLKFEHPPKK